MSLCVFFILINSPVLTTPERILCSTDGSTHVVHRGSEMYCSLTLRLAVSAELGHRATVQGELRRERKHY